MPLVNLKSTLTGIFRSVVTKKRRESAHARILEGNLNGELRACVDSRRFFCDSGPENPCICVYLTLLSMCSRAQVEMFTIKVHGPSWAAG